MHNKNRDLILGVIGILMLAIIALVVIDLAETSRGQIDTYGTVPDYNFIEMNGDEFGKLQMFGKYSIVNFFFTSCQGPCPFMNSKVAELYNKYVTSEDVQFISISVDPATDSLHVLQEYAKRFGVNDNRWRFLRGEIDEVQALTEKGFKLAGNLPNLHSTKLILVDRTGNIRGYYDSFEEESLNLLTAHIRTLLKKEQG